MLRALYYADKADFEGKRRPGSYVIEPRGMTGLFELVYFCPYLDMGSTNTLS